MDGNNTSVVIKFPDEEKSEDLNAYRKNSKNQEASKGYVIDQLYTNDEIAVYAMFEVSTFDIEKSSQNLRKVLRSNSSELKFSQGSTYKEKKDQNIRSDKATLIDFKEEPAAVLEVDSKIKTDPEENFWRVGKGTKRVKLKLASRGVNTDIDQSPRLLEEVQEAISLSSSKLNEKTMEMLSFFSEKSAEDLREMITRVNSTKLSLDGKNGTHGEKSFPNIVIVPVLLKNEDWNNFVKDENSQESQSFSKSLRSKTSVALDKVSVSTSIELSLLQHQNNEEPETLQNKPHNNEKANQIKDNAKSQEFILEEIKNIQKQFNTLLKSLESIGFNFAKEIKTKGNREPEEPQPVCKTLNKFDDVPIFSREISVFSEPRNSNRKSIAVDSEEELPIASSLKYVTKGHIDYKDVTEKYAINWNEFQNHKEHQKSKSQANICCSDSRNTNLKKSVSMDLSRESLGSKKLENTLFKLEGRIKKKSKSIRLNEEFGLVDNPNEPKLSSKFESAEVKSIINEFNIKAVPYGLLNIQKSQLNKDLEKGITEKTIPGRTRTNSADQGDKDTKVTKKTGLRSKTTEIVKVETKVPPSHEKKQNLKPLIRRVLVKDSPQSKLHVNLLIKSEQNCEQKKNSPVKCHSTRLPRANFQKKDVKKEKNAEADPISASKVSVKKAKNEVEIPEDQHPEETSMVLLELFSKKPPSSVEDLNSEIDFDWQFGNDLDEKEDYGSVKNDNLNNFENPVVKSVWALKKFFLFEDGKKKMEVFEASPNPPDYCFNQNSTEDKIR